MAKTGASEAGRRAQSLDIHKLMAELDRLETALPLHAIERVKQHAGGLDATGQIPIMHSRNAARQRAQKRVVAKTAHAVYALAHAANLIDGTQRARRHGVGRAGDKRNIGSDGKQLTRRTIARVERKRAQANQGGIERVTRGAQSRLKTTTAVITGRTVFLGNTDIGNLALNMLRERLAQLKSGLVIVVIDSSRALDVLADQHTGHMSRRNGRTMFIGDHGRHEYDAINRVILE